MPAYPLTARAAVNAAGVEVEAILDSIAHGESAIRPCVELGDPPPRVGWLGSPAPLPARFSAHDGRAARILFTAIRGVLADVESACRRWGASRVGAVISAPIADLDAAAVARRLDRAPPSPTAERLTELLGAATPMRGPVFSCLARGAGGAVAVANGLRLLDAGLLDAVLVGGCEVLGRTALASVGAVAPGEGAALLLFERHGEAFTEIVAAAEVREGSALGRLARDRPDAIASAGYVHAIEPDLRDPTPLHLPLVTTAGLTGHLGAAAGATELALAMACLERGGPPGALPDPHDASDLEGVLVDAPVGDGGRVALALRARLS